MKRAPFHGILSAVPTCFKNDFSLDLEAYRSQLRWLGASGLEGLLITATSGEFPTLSSDERLECMRAAAEERQSGRLGIPMLAHTGHSSLFECLKLTRAAQDLGLDGVMVITPYVTSVNQDEVYQFFADVISGTRLPVIIYNNPPRTGVTIEPQTVGKLARFENFAGLKDSGRNMRATWEMVEVTGGSVSILSGETDLTLPTLSVGGHGGILSTTMVDPRSAIEMYKCFEKRDLDGALAQHNRMLDLSRALAKHRNLHVTLKAALDLVGRRAGPPRPPMRPLRPESIAELKQDLRALGVLPAAAAATGKDQ